LQAETIEKLGFAVFPSIAMVAAMELDIFSQLIDKPLNSNEIAKKLNVKPQKLSQLLYALVAAELLTVEADVFSNTAETEHFLVKGKPEYLGGRYQFYRDRWNDALQSVDSIREAKPKAKLDFGEMSYDDLDRFLRGLHPSAIALGEQLGEQFDFSSCNKMLDVGGGTGGVSIALTKAHSSMQATVLELDSVIPVAKKIIQEEDAEERVNLQTVDIISEPPVGNFDSAVICNYLQILSSTDAIKSLHNIYGVLKEGSEIYIIGRIIDDSRTSPAEIVAFNMVFLNVFDEGQAYTEKEYRNWLQQVGFEFKQRILLPNKVSILIAGK